MVRRMPRLDKAEQNLVNRMTQRQRRRWRAANYPSKRSEIVACFEHENLVEKIERDGSQFHFPQFIPYWGETDAPR